MGSSPFQLPAHIFFHSFFFLHYSSYCKTTKKKKKIYIYIYIYIFFFFFPNLPVEPQRIIISLFFFSCFTYCKTSEKKNFLDTFFFSFISRPFYPKSSNKLFLELRGYVFLDPSVQCFPICYSPSIQFHTTHTTHNPITHHNSFIKMHKDA